MKKILLVIVLFCLISLGVYLYSGPAFAQQIDDMAQPSLDFTAANTSVSAENIEIVSQVGGNAGSIALRGNYAYVGIGPRLVIYDIEANSPYWIKAGTSEIFSNTVIDITFAGNYAFLALSSKVAILDISSPTQPILIGSIPVTAIEVYAEGDYLYIAGSGLKIYDVSIPSQPVQLSYLYNPTLGGTTLALRKTGSTVFITSMDSLHAVDVSDPEQPIYLDGITTGFQSSSVAIQGNYAYVTSPYVGMNIVDISQPANLSIISIGMNGWSTVDVAVNGNIAYVLMYPRGIYAIDISDVNNPTQIGSLIPVRGSSMQVALAGSYAYIANGWGGLHIADISDPVNMGFVDIDSDSAGIYTNQLAATANHVHAIGGMNGFAGHSPAVDISDPQNPVPDDSINLLYDYDMRALAGDDNNLFLSVYASVFASGPIVQIYDANNLSTPISTWDTGGHLMMALERNGQYLYGAANGRLAIVDVSNPASPAEVGAANLSDITSVGDIAVEGQYAYLGRYDEDSNSQLQGLTILNVSNPASPTEVGSFTTSGGTYADVYDVDVAGSLVYLAASDAGLRIVDVSNPSSPVEVGSHSFAAKSVTVSGRYAYVTDGLRLGIFDISDVTNPIQIGAFQMSGAADVLLVGDLIYLANGYGGLFVLRQTGTSTTVTSNQDATLVHADPEGKTATIEFPAGSVSSDTVLVYSPVAEVASNGLQYAGFAFDLTAYQNGIVQPDFIFSQPVNVTLTYLDDDVLGIVEEAMTLRVFDGAEWVDAASTCVPPSSYVRNTNQNTISIEICHLSQYALMAISPVYLPFVIR